MSEMTIFLALLWTVYRRMRKDLKASENVRLRKFLVGLCTRVKPHPPFQKKCHMKKGWDYTRVSTVHLFRKHGSIEEYG